MQILFYKAPSSVASLGKTAKEISTASVGKWKTDSRREEKWWTVSKS